MECSKILVYHDECLNSPSIFYLDFRMTIINVCINRQLYFRDGLNPLVGVYSTHEDSACEMTTIHEKITFHGRCFCDGYFLNLF